jgi:hypothetical protein
MIGDLIKTASAHSKQLLLVLGLWDASEMNLSANGNPKAEVERECVWVSEGERGREREEGKGRERENENSRNFSLSLSPLYPFSLSLLSLSLVHTYASLLLPPSLSFPPSGLVELKGDGVGDEPCAVLSGAIAHHHKRCRGCGPWEVDDKRR